MSQLDRDSYTCDSYYFAMGSCNFFLEASISITCFEATDIDFMRYMLESDPGNLPTS